MKKLNLLNKAEMKNVLGGGVPGGGGMCNASNGTFYHATCVSGHYYPNNNPSQSPVWGTQQPYNPAIWDASAPVADNVQVSVHQLIYAMIKQRFKSLI
jgi:hypothetical protein